MRLDWVKGSEHAPYYVALDKGFYEKAGLKVVIQEGEGSTVTAKLVGNGSNDFGVVAAGTVLLSVAEGVPLQSVAVIFQETPTAIIYPKNKPIAKLTDLYGKRLGVLLKSVTLNEWKAVAKQHGVDLSKIQELPLDRSIVEAMLSGRIDAGIAWMINDGIQLRTKGQETEWIRLSDLGLKIYSSTLVASTKMIKEKPDVVKAFVKATLEGWQYTKEHPDEALQIFFQNAPKADRNFNTQKLPLVLQLTESETSRTRGLGYAEETPWQNLKNLYKDFGILKNDVDLTNVYTNAFLPTK